jgi:hypothetical protein
MGRSAAAARSAPAARSAACRSLLRRSLAQEQPMRCDAAAGMRVLRGSDPRQPAAALRLFRVLISRYELRTILYEY